MRRKIATRLAVVGILLPYFIAVGGPAVLGQFLAEEDFNPVGERQAGLEAIGQATLIAYGLGILACIPALWSHYLHLALSWRMFMVLSCLALTAVAQFAVVVIVNFLAYIHAGGMFP